MKYDSETLPVISKYPCFYSLNLITAKIVYKLRCWRQILADPWQPERPE